MAVWCNLVSTLINVSRHWQWQYTNYVTRKYAHAMFVFDKFLSCGVPSVVNISCPCRTSYQSSPSGAISCFPRDSLHVFRHTCCDVTAVWCLWSSTHSLPTHFLLDHTLHQLAPAVSYCVSKEGHLATYNKS